MIWTLIGSIVSVFIFFAGICVGFYFKETQKFITTFKERLHKPPPESGPVKPYTQEEKEELDNPANNRMKELL